MMDDQPNGSLFIIGEKWCTEQTEDETKRKEISMVNFSYPKLDSAHKDSHRTCVSVGYFYDINAAYVISFHILRSSWLIIPVEKLKKKLLHTCKLLSHLSAISFHLLNIKNARSIWITCNFNKRFIIDFSQSLFIKFVLWFFFSSCFLVVLQKIEIRELYVSEMRERNVTSFNARHCWGRFVSSLLNLNVPNQILQVMTWREKNTNKQIIIQN